MKARHANSIRVGYCGECEGLHLELLNKTGEVIATAVLNQTEAADIATEAYAFVRDGAHVRGAALAKELGYRLQ
jgi:hypothetical protein